MSRGATWSLAPSGIICGETGIPYRMWTDHEQDNWLRTWGFIAHPLAVAAAIADNHDPGRAWFIAMPAEGHAEPCPDAAREDGTGSRGVYR